MRYAVFLRAVNGGPANRITMEDLRARVTALGLQDVASHLQTGNLAVTDPSAPHTEDLARRIEEGLAATGLVKVDAMVRTPAELADLLSVDHFAAHPAGDWRRCVTFLRRPPGRDATDRMAAKGWTVLRADDRTILSVYPRTQQGYALNLDTAWKTSTTTRWWNVVGEFVEKHLSE